MRKLAFLLTTIALILSCSVKEKPEFLGVENIKIMDATFENFTVSADALFKNPNSVGGQLSAKNIVVYINDNQTAILSSEEFDVPAKDLFSIPLVVNIPSDSLFNKNSLGGILGSLFSENIKVQYKGDIKYKVYGFTYTYPLDKIENIKIKL
ncbi:MAG: hypothetical protein KJO41_03705 [Bacteroidia bacterium]|nr:hypothetical protein [Bacteroidia bacterium]NNK59594.1 hypothetical protein [Flavobacteriaceae bacterium]